MQTKRIVCPKCKVLLDVRNSKNEEVKQITCPSCKAILQVKFATDDGATQLATVNNGATQLVMPKATSQAYLEYEGRTYPLKEGQNIVGRKGCILKATVQIDTADRYMSRQHCSITVTTLPDGTKKAVLSNYQNKNLTTIDGQPIETGDTIRLTDGNSIKMGHTTITFKLS